MKQFIAAVCILLPTVVFAQSGRRPEVDRAELYGGYSFLSVDGNGTSRQNFNGWEASGLLNLNKWLGAEGDLSGYYKSNIAGTSANAHDYLFAGGPRFSFRPLFFHALFGADHATISASAGGVTASASDTAFATLLGGGFEWKIGRQWAFRPSLDYVLTRHASTTQSDIRFGVGVAYAFGR